MLEFLLALAVWLSKRLAARLAPRLTPTLVWGSLLGGTAWGLLLTLLTPVSGLTWVLVAPFHHQALFLSFYLLGVASLACGFQRSGPYIPLEEGHLIR
ncbi:hypothetical protein DFAR_1870010 [Desulfarculales bacterium]